MMYAYSYSSEWAFAFMSLKCVSSIKETYWNVNNNIRKMKIDIMAADIQLQWCVLRGMLLMASSSYINYKETNRLEDGMLKSKGATSSIIIYNNYFRFHNYSCQMSGSSHFKILILTTEKGRVQKKGPYQFYYNTAIATRA